MAAPAPDLNAILAALGKYPLLCSSSTIANLSQLLEDLQRLHLKHRNRAPRRSMALHLDYLRAFQAVYLLHHHLPYPASIFPHPHIQAVSISVP